MVKMDMRKMEDMTKRMEGEDSLIEIRYRTAICNDCGLNPATYFIVKGLADTLIRLLDKWQTFSVNATAAIAGLVVSALG